MSQAQHTHPAGVPAPDQPYHKDGVPESGRSDFHRLVPRPENTTNPEQGKIGEAVEVVKGHKYKWAGNISHVEDDKVRVEDFSDISIDPQLEQVTQDLLQQALTCDARDKPAYSRSQNQDNITTETFTVPSPFENLRVCRKTYPYIDVREKDKKGRQQYSHSPIAKRIKETARDRVRPPPDRAQEEHVACRVLIRDNRKLLTENPKDRDKLKKLLRLAQADLYLHQDDATYQADLTAEMGGTKPVDCGITEADVSLAKKMSGEGNPFHRFQVDGEAAKACELIEGFDLVICRDKNNRLILGQITEAVQKLFPAGHLEKMARATQVAAYRLPIEDAELLRHPTNHAIHLAKFPNKDVYSKKCEQPHFAFCGVEHMGAHHETGSSSGLATICFQDFTAKRQKCKTVTKSSAWTTEKPKLEKSVYGTAAKASRLSLKAFDPELYKEYMEVRAELPDGLHLTLANTGDNPYGYLAHLFDVQTEGHIDASDWEGGLAALNCFGDFTGGNLVVPDLGLRIAFPSGSNCHLRGRELYHYVTGYEGHRYCIVLTNKETVRKTVPDFQKGYPKMMEKIAKAVEEVKGRSEDEKNRLKDKIDKVQEKAEKDRSDDEKKLLQESLQEEKLLEANKKGKGAVLELLWQSAHAECHESKPKKDKPAKGNSQRSKSEKDDSDQPAPKKQKMSESG